MEMHHVPNGIFVTTYAGRNRHPGSMIMYKYRFAGLVHDDVESGNFPGNVLYGSHDFLYQILYILLVARCCSPLLPS